MFVSSPLDVAGAFALLGTYEGREVQHDINKIAMHQKEMDIRPASRMDVAPLLRTDPHSGHIWCSTYPVHCTEPRSVVMQKTKGNPMRTDGTAGRRYTTGRESALGPVTVAPTRPSGEWTGSPHSTLPSRSTRQEGRSAGNDWLNSVARRGHQSGSDVNSTLYRLGPGRHDSIRFKQTENPIVRSPKEYNPTADVRMDVGVRGGASGGFGVGGLR